MLKLDLADSSDSLEKPTMRQILNCMSLLVRDYDEAIAFYVGTLGFSLVEDTRLSPEKRWVRVAPRGSSETSILLAKAKNEFESRAIGRQSGGRVFLFLETDDFWRDYENYRSRGVTFCEEPREEEYATVAVFEDIYENRWDLLQRKS
ncbi:glyoxalase family protein [Verrucomicrobiia bacterium DG1235]|nr:glyoxalase family protein [Verrucomicrobiae bacterium DG1235]